MKVPVVVLSVLAIIGGFVNLPPGLGNVRAFTNLLSSALPATVETRASAMSEGLSAGISAAVFAIGLLMAYLLFVRRRTVSQKLASTALGRALHRFWFADWGMDWLYDRAFVQPVIWFADIDRNDFIDAFYSGVARLSEISWMVLRTTENGRVRWYAAWITAGTVIFVAIVLWT